jgi:cell wall-associated NlpC family hydrolase
VRTHLRGLYLCSILTFCHGCGSGPANISGGYIFEGAKDLEYISMTSSGSHLSGYIQVVTSGTSGPLGTETQRLRFEGDIGGNSFTLKSDNFARFWGGGIEDCSGEATSDGLRLLIPRSNGQIATVNYKRADTDTWNKAVTAFYQRRQAELAANSQSSNEKTILGKLGQVTEKTPIRSEPNPSSRVLYQVAAYEYIVVQPPSNGWTPVLLKNGTHGYLSDRVVTRLPYNVTGSKDAAYVPRGQNADRIGAYVAGRKGESGFRNAQLVRNAYAYGGIDLPEAISGQVDCGDAVERLEDLVSGDRVFFILNGGEKPDMVGVYLGNGYFGYADEKSGKVLTQYLGDKIWLKKLVAARRGGPKITSQ